jgi:putative transcriptional regulator
MRSRKKTWESLAGSLLLAHPSMMDPNFRKTVILVSSHDEEGAMGIVLNRPAGKTLGEIDGAFAQGNLATVPLFAGGPVQVDRLVICGIGLLADGEGLRLHFGMEPHAAESLLREQSDDMQVRAFFGYSGWTAGQLEKELEHDTWAVSQIPSDLLDYAQDDALWRGVLSRVGPEWKLLADEPDDPGLN